MSNGIETSTEKVVSVRWRMNLPEDLVRYLELIAADEERELGSVAARWLKEFWLQKTKGI